jgi:hypothetical protein
MSRYTALHIQDAWEIPEFMSRIAALVAEGYTHINEVPAPCSDMAWLLSEDRPDNVQDLYDQWLDEEHA